jgi:protein-disulfide isomerase
MRRLILIVMAAALYLLPQAAFAQTAPQAPLLPQVQAQVQAQAQKVGDIFGLSADQVVAIGIGAIGGFAVAEAMHLAGILGVFAGGAIGNWWYAKRAEEAAGLRR